MANEQTIDERKVKLFDSMFDYVNDADLNHYRIINHKGNESEYVESIKPMDDSDFMIWAEDTLEYEGLEYTRVNFGEDDDPEEYGNSFLLSSALDEEVYMIFVRHSNGIYDPRDGHIFSNETDAINALNEEVVDDEN